MNARDLRNKLLAGRGHRIERSMPIILREDVAFKADLDFLIQHEIFRNGGHFHFVQIGANDGISRTDDLIGYIRKYSSSGIMVEPQPDLFAQLRKNFSEYPDIVLINKAIHASEASMPLYRLDPEILKDRTNIPHWAQTNWIASFDRSHVLEHAKRIGMGDDVIVEQEVSCTSLGDILASNTKAPDILKVDTEGYDYEVLTMLDLDVCRPTIICFEHLHMSNEQYESLLGRLMGVNYRFLADKMNTTAYLPSSTVI